LHNATLVHDDIQDQDTTRRGNPTLWVNHGVAQAINAGDFLLMLPFLALAEFPAASRGDLSIAVASAATRTVRGQVEEMGMREAGRLDWEAYISAASGKTGALVALPAEGSALLAGRPPSEAQAVADTFANIGLLFQIQDDVVDLFGDKGREASGSDILEGKVSALVVELLTRRPTVRGEVLAILDKPRASTTRADVARMEHLFRESGALAAVLGRLVQIQSEVRSAPVIQADPNLAAVAELLLKLALAPVAHLLRPETPRSVKNQGAES
jgi:geranylgeranyl diphosphate synthase type I